MEYLPEGPFDLIVADPPWSHKAWSDRGLGRAPARHYKVQPLEWICSLPVAEASARDAHLMLWITGPHLAQGCHLAVLDAWGFKASSIGFVWAKPLPKMMQSRLFAEPLTAEDFFMSLGHTTRQNAEFVILGRKGKPKRHSRSVRQLLIEPRREHSRKPEDFYAAAEAYAGAAARKLELFPRTRRPGWECWGDQIDHFAFEEDRRKKAA